MDQEFNSHANDNGLCRPLRGLGILGGRDPRPTLATLAHPGLLHIAASRLVDRESQIELMIATTFFIWRLRVHSGIYLGSSTGKEGRTMKITTVSMLSIASIGLLFSACGNSTTNTANKSNTGIVANSNQPAVSSPTPAGKSDGEKIQGELQAGQTESVILYVGKETGDYAAYCFTNDSEAGRAILAACKDRAQCEVIGKFDYESRCKVPGLEADLSASGKILKVESVKSLGSKM
jgi:hypothetical protein